jgi:transketolase
MRNFFAKQLVSLAEQDESILLLYGDIGNKLFDEFKARFPKRFFNCGVAEANMVGVAAGLAKSGFKPWVYTINSFLYLKALEQIKLDVCYQGLPVTLVGTGGGLAYSELGTTHHSLEDIGVLSQIPKISVFSPGTTTLLAETMNHISKSGIPAYIRIGKKESFDPDYKNILSGRNFLNIHSIGVYSKITSSVILSTGTIVEAVDEALETINSEHNSITHFHLSQVAPLSLEFLKGESSLIKNVIVVEEHFPGGGLYPQLCVAKEVLGLPFKIHRIGPPHEFFVGLGDLSEAREEIRMSAHSIAQKILEILRA